MINREDSLGHDAYQFTKSVMRVQADVKCVEAHLEEMQKHSQQMLSRVTKSVAQVNLLR